MATKHTMTSLLFTALLFFLVMYFSPSMAATECPLDLTGSNFSVTATMCSQREDRGKCCRYINALIAISIARYANLTSNLGVAPDLSEICLHTISQTLELYGVTRNATAFCGFGTKIPVNYECQGRTTVTQMLQSPRFTDVTKNCKLPLTEKPDCRKCLNAGVGYVRNLVGAANNLTLSTCRDATFVTLASGVDNTSAVDIAGCFFGVQALVTAPGPSMFKKFSYKETKKATNNFSFVIGQGGFGTVYKAQFSDGLVAAVKRMDKVSEQAEDDFCKEIELLARLHHRHLVALRGFCIERHERFLMYEYMANGSLKDHLHTPGRTLSWRNRIKIAIDVANALEYLHFYCNPPLCHRDIKSSNILLDENFVAKLADFGLAHASKDGSVFFEPVNTDIRGTPGYMDPEYVFSQELTEKSDVYSYGVVLLELLTSRRAIQDDRNLVEWSQAFMASDSTIHELVDPNIGDSFDVEQLQTIVSIVRWCTQSEGRARPSIKQVLRLLYDCSDPMHSDFVEAVEEEDYDGTRGRGSTSKGKLQSWDGRCLASSSSTSRSYCSRSFLLETGSPQSPSNIPSI
ncbi:putative receptor-like protein kinase At1g49730 isoform X2 [Apium graveolens]|uniref:putative receptor-like protein kinase At1g49730 isoform X2 n=1 Tax=Apium graveolens TaxID=4045 RepID=UPI003D7BBC9A